MENPHPDIFRPGRIWNGRREPSGTLLHLKVRYYLLPQKLKIDKLKAIEFIASLIIPGAGIIKAIIGIYDTIVFFIQKAKDIAQMVGNFLGSIGEIAMGNIGAAANALENGLATALTLVISFLAKLIHLDGVTAKIRAALNKIRGKVENMMAKVAKWIAEKGKSLWRRKSYDSNTKKWNYDETDPLNEKFIPHILPRDIHDYKKYIQ